MKKLILNAVLVLSLVSIVSCSPDNDQDLTVEQIQQIQQQINASKIAGELQLYRQENLVPMIDQWTGTEWTYVDTWMKTSWNDSEVLMVFNVDGTFTERYAETPTFSGTWEIVEEGKYTFTYDIDDNNTNEALMGIKYLNILCDNTFSVTTENNDIQITYYRVRDTLECSDAINYNVVD